MFKEGSQPPIEIYAFSDRSYDQYLDFLCLNEEFLKGKKTLDVGAGLSNFVEDINDRLGEFGAEAIALDINYDVIDDPNFRKKLEKRKGWIEIHRKTGTAEGTMSKEEYERVVDERIHKIIGKKREHPEWFKTGDRKKLPYDNNSFDLVIYNNSLFPALNHEENNPAVIQIINEGLRVIRQKGQIRIIPTNLYHYYKEVPERLSQYQDFIRVGQRDFNEEREDFNNPGMLEYYKKLHQSGIRFYVIQELDENAEYKEERWINNSLIVTKGDHQFTSEDLNKGDNIRAMELNLQEAISDDCIVPLSLNYHSPDSSEN